MRKQGLREIKQIAEGHTAPARELRFEFQSLCFSIICFSTCEWNVFLTSKLLQSERGSEMRQEKRGGLFRTALASQWLARKEVLTERGLPIKAELFQMISEQFCSCLCCSGINICCPLTQPQSGPKENGVGDAKPPRWATRRTNHIAHHPPGTSLQRHQHRTHFPGNQTCSQHLKCCALGKHGLSAYKYRGPPTNSSLPKLFKKKKKKSHYTGTGFT